MRSNAELSENWIALKFLPVEKSFDWKCSWGLVDMCIDNTKPRNESVIIYQFSPFKSSQSEWSLFTYRKSMSNNFVQSKQKKNLFQKVATKSSIPKEKWLSIEMGKYPKNSANDWKFVTIGKKCEKYFSKSIDRVLTSSSIFFPISFLFLNWNSSSAWSHRMPFLSLRSPISHLFFTSHCILLHQSTSSNYNIGNEKTKPLATEKKTSIFNGQFTVLHLKACYRYGPITGMLIVITQSISEKMRSLLIHLCREWRLVNEDLFFLPTAESN